MLVVSRKLGEEVVIGQDVVVRVVAVRGNTVRLGIDAPRQLSVDRREVRVRRNDEESRGD